MKLRTNKRCTFGILGGMGPYATQMFYKSVLDFSNVKKDWEFPHLVIDSANYIPSRTRHILYNEDSPVEDMIDVCLKLQSYPVDYIAIPCNSASVFIEYILPKVDVPIINIIETTASNLPKKNCKCVILGGRVTYSTKSYKKYLLQNGHEYVDHHEDIQLLVENLIEKIKINDLNNAQILFNEIVQALNNTVTYDCIILGCTELTIFTNNIVDGVHIIDSSGSLARKIVELSKE